MTQLTGNETLYVLGQDNNGSDAAETFRTTTQDIADLASAVGQGGVLNIAGVAGTLPLTVAETVVLVNTTFAPCSFTLPVGSVAGRKVTMIDVNGNAGTNPITQSGTVNGSATPNVFNSNGVIVTFWDNGSSWNM